MSLKQKCRKYDLKLINKFKLDTISMDKWIISLKERLQSILEFKKGKKWDSIRKTRSEIGILLNYLPQQLSKEKLSEIFRKAVDKMGAESIKDEKYYGNCCT